MLDIIHLDKWNRAGAYKDVVAEMDANQRFCGMPQPRLSPHGVTPGDAHEDRVVVDLRVPNAAPEVDPAVPVGPAVVLADVIADDVAGVIGGRYFVASRYPAPSLSCE